MGLDTYAARSPDWDEDFGLTDEDIKAFKEADVQLCECDGDTSFRGKLYSELVLEVTGVGLHQEWVPPRTVKAMSSALDQCNPEEVLKNIDPVFNHTERDILELRKFFRVCAERDLGLFNSW